jgi:hypothetical protein
MSQNLPKPWILENHWEWVAKRVVVTDRGGDPVADSTAANNNAQSQGGDLTPLQTAIILRHRALFSEQEKHLLKI